jgi:hypothetical protein
MAINKGFACCVLTLPSSFTTTMITVVDDDRVNIGATSLTTTTIAPTAAVAEKL